MVGATKREKVNQIDAIERTSDIEDGTLRSEVEPDVLYNRPFG